MKILIADDNVDSADSAAQYLRICGHDVDTAYSGYGAEVLLEQREFDGVILDYCIKDLTGLDVLRWMRYRKILTPAILTTGVVPQVVESIKEHIEAERLGPAVVLNKPFEVEVVESTIESFAPHAPETKTVITQTVQKTLTVSQETT